MASPKDATAPGGKQPYSPPTLTVYGDLRVITAAKTGNRDDSGKPKTWNVGMP
jgi:hypothetical protein